MALQVQCLTSLDEISAAEWDGLVAASTVGTPFQSYLLHAAWWSAFGADHELVLIRVRDGDETVALAPLVTDAGEVLRFCGYNTFDYLDMPVRRDRPDALPVLIEALKTLPWRRVVLDHIHEDSRLLKEKLPLSVEISAQKPAPNYRFTGTDEDRKLAAKKSLKRHYNHFRRHGTLAFTVLETAEDVYPHLEDFFQQHIERRALTEFPSQFLKPQERALYRELARALGAAGWLRFAVVNFDDEVIAYHFGFEFQRTMYWYKPTFNVKYQKQSPGEVLLKLIIEDCIERKVAELDFTIGDEPFKYRFSNRQRTVYQLLGFRSGMKLRSYQLENRAKDVLRPLLRRKP